MIQDIIILRVREIYFLGIEVFNFENFIELMMRFTFNFLVIGLIVRGLYYPVARRKDYLFSYILIGVIVFLMCFLLNSVVVQLGFALGLFAIFGIIRYRTNPMPIKEMTYLFVVIGISLINSLATEQLSYVELIFTNLVVITLIYLLEKIWLLKSEASKTIDYEKIDLIKPEKHDELIKDLKERTGLEIHRIEIGSINFLRDTVRIRIFFMENNGSNHEDVIMRSYDDDDDD
jgi:hypothetical protein